MSSNWIQVGSTGLIAGQARSYSAIIQSPFSPDLPVHFRKNLSQKRTWFTFSKKIRTADWIQQTPPNPLILLGKT
jgi:hypothetical protein